MVEAGRFFPVALTVTAGAILAQRRLVLVIFCMAGNAGLAQFDPIQMAGVAEVAGRRAMLSTQDIFGIDVMVKEGRFPQFGTMAGFALLAILTFVALGAVIIFLVTTDTSARRILVVVGLVTGFTFHIGMLVQQRKTRGRMIKLGLFPGIFAMTISAFHSKRSLVLVVLAMAAIALQRGLTILLARHVALVACRRLVFATQNKVSLGMVKLFLVKARNLSTASFVIGVTTAANLRFKSSMKADLRAHISPNVLVAVLAQGRLRIAVEPDVTFLAIVFHFGMALNHLARRQDGLDALGARQPRHGTTPQHHRAEDGESLAL